MCARAGALQIGSVAVNFRHVCMHVSVCMCVCVCVLQIGSLCIYVFLMWLLLVRNKVYFILEQKVVTGEK